MAEIRLYTGEGAADTGGFSHDVSKATLTYMLDETFDEDREPTKKAQGDFPTPQDVPDVMRTILGYTETAVWDGRIFRSLPIRCPKKGFTRLYAASVPAIRPAPNSLHEPAYDDNPSIDLGGNAVIGGDLSGYAHHQQYLIDVEFLPRPYTLKANRDIRVRDLTWWDVNGEEVSTPIAEEWKRFTDHWTIDREDIATAIVGTGSKFKSTDSMNGVPFNAQTSVWLPNFTFKIKWSEVPWRYYSSLSSFLRLLRGKVNQFEFFGYQPGELLYTNTTYVRYDRGIPLPDDDEAFFDSEEQKLADFEITFIGTSGRIGTALPAPPANPNHIMAGHNLGIDLLSKRYRYVVTNDKDNLEEPPYLSAPMELLFTDPDAVELVSLGG